MSAKPLFYLTYPLDLYDETFYVTEVMKLKYNWEKIYCIMSTKFWHDIENHTAMINTAHGLNIELTTDTPYRWVSARKM